MKKPIKKQYGFNVKVLSWLDFCLNSHSLRVTVAGVQSLSHDLTFGVPQGSILGPLLFILFTFSNYGIVWHSME